MIVYLYGNGKIYLKFFIKRKKKCVHKGQYCSKNIIQEKVFLKENGIDTYLLNMWKFM